MIKAQKAQRYKQAQNIENGREMRTWKEKSEREARRRQEGSNSVDRLLAAISSGNGLDDYDKQESERQFKKAVEQEEKQRRAATIIQEWENSGQTFFDFFDYNDEVYHEFFIDIAVWEGEELADKLNGYLVSASTLVYRYGESEMEPLKAIFFPTRVGCRFVGYATENGDKIDLNDVLISPKEAMEQGLLDEEEMARLKSFGSSERYPIRTWKSFQTCKMRQNVSDFADTFKTFIFPKYHLDTEFIQNVTGNENPHGQLESKEDMACIVVDAENRKVVRCKALFKELSEVEWEFLGYTANGNVYDDPGAIRSIALVRRGSYTLADTQTKTEAKPSSEGLQALNLW